MCKVQCFCLTQTGLRCKRYCVDGLKKCFQHQKIEDRLVRMLPSLDLNAEPVRVVKPVIQIDLTDEVETSSTRTIQTRSMTRRIVEIQIESVQNTIAQTREPRMTRLAYRQMQNQPEERVKPRPTHTGPRKPSRPKNNKEEDCCICYDQKVEEDNWLKCGHCICGGCIKQLRNDKCPMCRSEIECKLVSKADKKRMLRRKRDDDEERNEQLYQNYLRELVASGVATPAMIANIV